MQISHNYTHIPSLPPLPPSPPPSHPSRSSQSTRLGSPHHTAASYQPSISHMMVHTYQYYFLNSTYPLLPRLCSQVHSLHLYLLKPSYVVTLQTLWFSSENDHSSVDSYSGLILWTSWGTHRALAHNHLFSEAPILDVLPFRTNSSMMPSISWFSSLPLKTLDGSESAFWGPPWFSAHGIKGERLSAEAGWVFLSLVDFPSPESCMGWLR